ncbi:nuclease SbcCD, D subunit [Dehalogenimonas lykanthroporepellens BL-DC-9]|nr:nuclease SbcCD, D subunit [Dehalogenimonas lykanthroporepellens BL-DC-9]
MKIIHFADLHLGVETYGRVDPATGLNTRFQDFLEAFDKLVDFAITEKADLVLFCGDAFKHRDPTQTQQREFARRVRRLADSGVPVFLLVGNHDLPAAAGRATSTEIYDTLKIPGVTVASRPEITIIQTPSGPIQVAALPWPRKGALEVKAQKEEQNLSAEETKSRIESILSATIARLAEEANPTIPAVLAAHIWVDGARLGSEKSLVLGNEPTVMLSNIIHPVFDYVALGHLHKRQELNQSPPVVYAGSLERLDFGEEKDDKGFYIVEITEEAGRRRTHFTFHRLDGRRFLTLESAVAEDSLNPTVDILNLLETSSDAITDAVVQLKIHLPESLVGTIRDNAIREALKPAHYATIARVVERRARSRFGGAPGESLTPRQALERYLAGREMSEAHRKRLMEYADRLLAETGTS